VAKPKYIMGFWFWLDLISTASLLLDIPALQVDRIETVTLESDRDQRVDCLKGVASGHILHIANPESTSSKFHQQRLTTANHLTARWHVATDGH